MDDVAVRLEHVDLLDGLDRLGVELLQVGLELLVIVVGASRRTLDRSSGSSLSTAQRKTSVDLAFESFRMARRVLGKFPDEKGGMFCNGDIPCGERVLDDKFNIIAAGHLICP